MEKVQDPLDFMVPIALIIFAFTFVIHSPKCLKM